MRSGLRKGLSKLNGLLKSKAFIGVSLVLAGKMMFSNNEIVEKVVGKGMLMEDNGHLWIDVFGVEDIHEGQLKEVVVGPNSKEDTITFAKVDGQIYAFGSKCTHFGFPLAKGILLGDQLFCPLHLASFSVKTGFPESGVAYNGIPVYQVKVENNRVFVYSKKSIGSSSVEMPMVTRDESNTEQYVIIGGGPASESAVETLRQSGFSGKIVIVSKEDFLPYDRTLLTKAPTTASPKLQIRTPDFYTKMGVEFKANTEVKSLDNEHKTITTSTGEVIPFDKVLVASGLSASEHPNVKSDNQAGVFTIRSLSDIQSLQRFMKENEVRDIVVVGSNFIGPEIASSLKQANSSSHVSLISNSKYLCERVFGSQVGERITSIFQQNGIEVKSNVDLSAVSKNSEGKVSEITLSDNSKIPAQLVIIGMGASPNSEFLPKSLLDSKGYLSVNNFFQGSDPSVFAAGDIVSFKHLNSVSIPHYSEAINQGTYAAWSMLGRRKAYTLAPFFWTRFFNKSFQFVGVPSQWDDLVMKGNLQEDTFVGVYCHNNNCHSAVASGKTKEIVLLNQAIRLGLSLDKSEVVKDTFFEDLEARVRKNMPNCACGRVAESCGRN